MVVIDSITGNQFAVVDSRGFHFNLADTTSEGPHEPLSLVRQAGQRVIDFTIRAKSTGSARVSDVRCRGKRIRPTTVTYTYDGIGRLKKQSFTPTAPA